MNGKIPAQNDEIKNLVASTNMRLTGVSAWSPELAVLLAHLLQRHGYIEKEPTDLAELLAAARATVHEGDPIHAYVQEGGSSVEIYLHLADSDADAKAGRADCATGAYNTSAITAVPRSLALHPKFHDTVQDILQSSLDMESFDAEAPAEAS
jgi:hypothetical protein